MADFWVWLAGANAVVVAIVLIGFYKYRYGLFKFCAGEYIRQQEDRNRDQDALIKELDRVQKERADNYLKINEIDHIQKDYEYLKADVEDLKKGHLNLAKEVSEMKELLAKIDTKIDILLPAKKE